MTLARDMARGHWHKLLPALGVDSQYLVNKHGPCPMCGGSDRFRWDNKDGEGGFICGQCGGGDGFDLARKVTGKGFADILQQIESLLGQKCKYDTPNNHGEESRLKDLYKSIWTGAGQATATDPVGVYLTHRLGRFWAFQGVRFNRYAWHTEERARFPAMVTQIVTPEGRAVNLHLTYLTHDGYKASIAKPKLVMAGRLPDGCAIRLGPERERMGVAEGIETALSAAILFKIPVWACVNGNLLAKWQPPETAKEILIFGDNDQNFTGQAKAYHLANRLEVQFKRKAKVLIPPQEGQDWNDHLLAQPTNHLRLVK